MSYYNVDKGKEFEEIVKKFLIQRGFIITSIDKRNSYFPDIETKFQDEEINIECKYIKNLNFVNGIFNKEKKKIKNFNKIYLVVYGNDEKGIFFEELFIPLEKRKKILNLIKQIPSGKIW